MTNQEVQVVNQHQDLNQEEKMEEVQEVVERKRDLETGIRIEKEGVIETETARAQLKEVGFQTISPA